jgi:hypothetical protein
VSKKKRIKELERRVADLEQRLAVQEAQPVYMPWQPPVSPFWESPFKYGTGDSPPLPLYTTTC